MAGEFKINRSALIIFLIVGCIAALTQCINKGDSKKKGKIPESKMVEYAQFAGSSACISCHKDIYDSHIHTEHFLTSQRATEKNIMGSFEKNKNGFVFDERTKVVMEKRDSGFYQSLYANGVKKTAGRFDMVIGSGRKGQSYLSWMNDKLVQMPITYFTPEGQWSNSPGYPSTKAVFNRPITSRCMECHSTFMKTVSAPGAEPEHFDRSQIILGVDCEKCHGPAAAHVNFQTQNPELKEARFIVNPAKLTRQQNLYLCSVCHGGRLQKTKPSFSFTAGDNLDDYFIRNTTSPDVVNIDVHGNQFGLLSVSKCFVMSEMTCTSCHNTHENEQNKIAVFSQRCINCHSEGHGVVCKKTESMGAVINQNCIDCHMPKQPSHAVAVYLQGATIPTTAMMRTHYIKPYPEETEKVMEHLQKLKGKK